MSYVRYLARSTGGTLLLGGTAAAAVFAGHEIIFRPQLQMPPVTNARLTGTILARLYRDVYCVGSLVSDYSWSLAGLEGDKRAAALAACHERGADRLLGLIFANKGVYIKMGQHMGQLDHLLPAAYVSKMQAHALSRCPVSTLDEVRRVFQEDVGQAPEDLFASFAPEPLASASLAQVHLATDSHGRKLAIKVQHEGLRETAAADISTINFLVRAVKWAFPEYDYTWLIEEVQRNLPQELDFENEALNAQRCKLNFSSPRSRFGRHVHVPDVYPDLSSARILTMEYVEGVMVTDVAGIQALGFKLSAVARLVAEAFSEMIFHFGDVHCDPHAANMLVRKDSSGALQLVLLDHGLYRQLDDEFRREYAGLWKALFFADVEGIKDCSMKMNAGELYPLFASMLTMRPWEAITNPNLDHKERLAPPAQDEARAAMHRDASKYTKEIGRLLLTVPRELLLLLKTNDCLRSIDYVLNCRVNTFVITCRASSIALADLTHDRSVCGRFRAFWDIAIVDLRLLLLQLATWWAAPPPVIPLSHSALV